jgi:hypothetical protein
MGENNIIWNDFKFPVGCTLEEHRKSAVIRGANSGKYHPFRICKDGQDGKCPPKIEQKCFNEGVGIILDAKRK